MIAENSSFIDEQRKDVSFSVKDSKAIRNWEIQTAQAEPPLMNHLKKLLDAKKKQEDEEREMETNKIISLLYFIYFNMFCIFRAFKQIIDLSTTNISMENKIVKIEKPTTNKT